MPSIKRTHRVVSDRPKRGKPVATTDQTGPNPPRVGCPTTIGPRPRIGLDLLTGLSSTAVMRRPPAASASSQDWCQKWDVLSQRLIFYKLPRCCLR